MWLKMLFSKIYLAALYIVFVVTIVLLSICGILTLFKMLQSYVIAGSITSMMDVITKYGVLILFFQFTSHFVLVFIMDTPVRDKDLLRKVPIAYSFQCAQAVPQAYSRRNSMRPMPHKDS